MLGSDRFAFENGNVIDPGDLPPGQPTRNNTNNNNTPSTCETSATEDEDDQDYNEARESAARLLNDISDLDLSPVKKPPLSARLPFRDFPRRKNNNSQQQGGVYSPYDDDEPPVSSSHSLPAGGADEARLHAAALLSRNTHSAVGHSPQMGRTMKLSAPYISSPSRFSGFRRVY